MRNKFKIVGIVLVVVLGMVFYKTTYDKKEEAKSTKDDDVKAKATTSPKQRSN